MSSENAPREALAAAIHGADWTTPWEETVGRFISDWDEPSTFAPNEKETYQVYADAVIAHLWQVADDPAFVEAVVLSGMLFPGRASEPEVKQQRALAAGWILRVLTPLIGPRPTEQERDDE